MPRTDALDKAIRKYEAEKVDRVVFRVPKGEKERLQQHAKAHGESLKAFICRAIAAAIELDNAGDK